MLEHVVLEQLKPSWTADDAQSLIRSRAFLFRPVADLRAAIDLLVGPDLHYHPRELRSYYKLLRLTCAHFREFIASPLVRKYGLRMHSQVRWVTLSKPISDLAEAERLLQDHSYTEHQILRAANVLSVDLDRLRDRLRQVDASRDLQRLRQEEGFLLIVDRWKSASGRLRLLREFGCELTLDALVGSQMHFLRLADIDAMGGLRGQAMFDGGYRSMLCCLVPAAKFLNSTAPEILSALRRLPILRSSGAVYREFYESRHVVSVASMQRLVKVLNRNSGF